MLTRQVMTSVQPLPVEALQDAGREVERARLQLAGYYAEDLAPALAAAVASARDLSPEWTITRALGPSPDNALLAVRDVHVLSPGAIWELRDLAAAGVRLLLLTTPERRGVVDGADAPFYGMSTYLEMPTLSLVHWSKAAGGQLTPEALRELLQQTRYRTAITLEILERHAARGADSSVAYAYFDAVDARADEAREVLNLSRSLHELAPKLLLTLAAGEGPYSIQDERSDRIALALRHLRRYGIIEQLLPRSWQIADPLLSAAIRRHALGETSYVDLYPDTTGQIA